MGSEPLTPRPIIVVLVVRPRLPLVEDEEENDDEDEIRL